MPKGDETSRTTPLVHNSSVDKGSTDLGGGGSAGEDSINTQLFASSSRRDTFDEPEDLTGYVVDLKIEHESSPLVRISLASQSTPVTVTFLSKVDISHGHDKIRRKGTLAAGEYQLSRKGDKILLKNPRFTHSFASPLVFTPQDATPWKYQRSSYEGQAVATVNGNTLMLVNRLPVESYLRGVVPLEIGARSFVELEALKAQAVAARTYTYKRMKAQKNKAYDLLSTVADQVYGGVGKAQATTDSAIIATHGEVLVDGKKELIGAFYHSTCGGQTASIDQMWSGPPVPYLQTVSDKSSSNAWCSASSLSSWNVQWSVAELSSILTKYSRSTKSQPFSGTVQSVRVTKRSASGRVLACEVISEKGRYIYGKDKIRQVFRRPTSSNPLLWSASFTLHKRGDTITAVGGGFGHGIGMCQFGALGRAKAGQSYTTILSAYYRGTHIERVVIK